MTTVFTRQTTATGASNQNAPLSNAQVDQNFIDLNTNKLELGQTFTAGTANSIPYLSGSKVLSNSSTLVFDGTNFGIGTQTPAYRLEVNGSFAATTKSFLIDHPTKPGKQLRYGSLEGPENGVYVRGRVNGNVIELPEYWTKLVDSEQITVQLTPIGKHQKLYVTEIRDNKVYIANDALFASEINCFYYVLAERCDVEKLEVEIG